MSVTPNPWDATLVALKDPAWLPRSSEDVPPVTLKNFQSAMDVESSEVLEGPTHGKGNHILNGFKQLEWDSMVNLMLI